MNRYKVAGFLDSIFHRETNIWIVGVKRAYVVRCTLDLVAVENDCLCVKNQTVKVRPVDFVEQFHRRHHVADCGLVHIIQHGKIVLPVHIFQYAVNCCTGSVVFQSVIFVFRYRFKEIAHLLLRNGSLLHRYRMFHIQIICTGISILSGMAFAVCEIESTAIQIGIFGFLPVKDVERFISATIHHLRRSIRINYLAGFRGIVLPIAEPTLELLRFFDSIFHGKTHLLIKRFAEILKIEFIFAHKQVACFFGDYAIFVQFIGYSRPFFVSCRIKQRLYFLAHGYNHGRHIYTCLPCGKYPMRAGQSLISIVPVLNKHNSAPIVAVVLKLVYEVMVFAAACNSVGRRYLHRIDFSDICAAIFRRKLDISIRFFLVIKYFL